MGPAGDDGKQEMNKFIAINCKFESNCSHPAKANDLVEAFIRQSRAPNTLKAYAADLASFWAWGGLIPSTPEVLARYLAEKANSLKPATLSRHIASIAVAHRSMGLASPTSSELVRSVIKGIRRVKGVAQKAAKPLVKEDLFAVLDAMGDTIKDARDRSLLLVGFAGGFRRSELVGLNVEDLAFVRQGMIITLRHSKTDQEGQGRKIGIPFGRTRHCPVKATETWLQRASVNQGPLYVHRQRRPHNATAAFNQCCGEHHPKPYHSSRDER